MPRRLDELTERFTDPARRAVSWAAELAARSGSATVTPAHVLLAIFDGPPSIASIVLKEAGIRRNELAELSRVQQPRGVGRRQCRPAEFDVATRRLMVEAEKEAVRLRHYYVNPAHLLLAALALGHFPTESAGEIRDAVLAVFGLPEKKENKRQADR